MNKVQQGLSYLDTLTPWNGRGGFALEAIRNILKRLDDPQDSYPTIHIAGTNGKGSVSSATASILAAAGYKVGLNTSPHLQSLNERVVFDGLPISMETLGEFAYDIKSVSAKALEQLSFHEAITALSFLAFRELGVEWAVVEVGLGGRLDASNVISRPAATAIVTIDFDHQHILGNTLAQIAAEKAGIIKQGVPQITGNLPMEAERVVERIVNRGKHYRFATDFGCSNIRGEEGTTFEYWGKDFPISPLVREVFRSPLNGEHQAHNLAVAATLGLAVGMSVEAVSKGIENVYWPGRLERIQVEGRGIVMDCAHNPAGIKSFIQFLDNHGIRNLDLTFGVLDTKNWQEMIGLLKPYVSHWRLVLPESERALPLERVRDEICVSGTDIRVSLYGNDYDRLIHDIIDHGEGDDRFVTGSMYMVGRLRSLLGISVKPLWPPVL